VVAVALGSAPAARAAVVTLEIVADTADGQLDDLATPFLDGGTVGYRARSAIDASRSIVVDGTVLVTSGDTVDGAALLDVSFASIDGAALALRTSDNCYAGDVFFQSHHVFVGGAGRRVVDRDTAIDGFSNPLNLSTVLTPSVGFSSVENGTLAFYIDTTTLAPYSQTSTVFRRDSGGAISVVAATGDAIPDGGGSTFSAFGPPVLDSGRIAFRGRGLGRGGISTWDAGQLARVVDSTTQAPGHEPTAFGDAFDKGIARAGGDTAFVTTGSVKGVWKVVDGTLQRVSDSTTGIPDGDGNLFEFFGVDIERGAVAFVGRRDNQFLPPRQYGVYTDLHGTLEKVVDLDDTIGGRTPDEFEAMTGYSLSGNRILFLVRFTDASEAVVLATVFPEGTDPGIFYGDGFERGDMGFWTSVLP
jgi:hypothetical protein